MILTTHKIGKIRFPDAMVAFDLEGPGGNAFAIMADVGQALRKAGATDVERHEFFHDAMEEDVSLLVVCRRWVTVPWSYG